MDASIRIRLETGGQVLVFSKANPSSDPNHIALVVRLEDRCERGVTLNEQALKGELTVHAMVQGKAEVKNLIHGQLMALNVVAQLASVEQPGVAELVMVPGITSAHEKFLNTTRVMIELATENADLFGRHGLPETFVADLTALADQLAGALNSKKSGTRTHVGANADLEAVAGEIMMIVKALDKLNRLRFRKDPEQLAAWKHARDVAWPLVKPEGPASADPAA